MQAKSVARKATAVAAAALGTTGAYALTPTAAHASTIGAIFLYRSRVPNVNANCSVSNRELKNYGNVNLGEYYVFGTTFEKSTSGLVGDFTEITVEYKQDASTVADKQEWCYDTSYYYQYYAANTYHRYMYQYWACSDLNGCAYLGTQYSSWASGL
jgi:hypothetical protein